MLIVERHLELVEPDGTVLPVPIRVFASAVAQACCRFEIAWPGEVEDAEVFGSDQREAVDLALRLIGARLELSEAHRDGRLRGLHKGGTRVFPGLSPSPRLGPVRLDA